MVIYDKPGCEQYVASGQCSYDEGSDECRHCAFNECLNDMASDLEDDMHGLIDKFGEETDRVVKDFITRERKAMEKKVEV